MKILITALMLVGLTACNPEPVAEWDWVLPDHFPVPNVPEDNPLTQAKVDLGRYLFYDTRLSVNNEMSCASCHKQELAFTDGKALSDGATGEVTPRGSMSLANVVYSSRLTWANHLLDRLEDQSLTPLFGEEPVEMGMAGLEDRLTTLFSTDPMYSQMFQDAFPDDDHPFSIGNLTKALASFERILLSFDTPFDEYMSGNTDALSDSAKRGLGLFLSERLECFHCHGGFNFSDSLSHQGTPFDEVAFHNTGLYNIDGEGAYPHPNQGLFSLTEDPLDMGRFKAPSLRNIGVTAPYMHDGSIETLREVVEHYAAGGRTITEGEHAGVGSDNPYKSEFVPGFIISDEEMADLLSFIETLTDEMFLTNPTFSDPFQAQ